MEKDKKTTKVSFWIEASGNGYAQVFAYFPNEKYDSYSNSRLSYAHYGQHSGCSPAYLKQCKPATEEQYSDLKIELEGLGYNLNIIKPKSI